MIPGFPVLGRLDGGITFDAGALIGIVRRVKPQMVDADFSRNVLCLERAWVEQFEFPGGRQMQDVKPGIMALRQFHREGRRLVTGLRRADLGMGTHWHILAKALPEALLVRVQQDLIQREYAGVVLLQKHLKGMLDQG